MVVFLQILVAQIEVDLKERVYYVLVALEQLRVQYLSERELVNGFPFDLEYLLELIDALQIQLSVFDDELESLASNLVLVALSFGKLLPRCLVEGLFVVRGNEASSEFLLKFVHIICAFPILLQF